MLKKYFFVCVCLCLSIALAAVLYWRQGVTPTQQSAQGTSDSKSNSTKMGTEQGSGGTATDSKSALPVDLNSPKTASPAKPQEFKAPPQNFGRAEPVKSDKNAQAASVAEALKTKAHPERLSALLPPTKPFDPAAFKANPAEYLNTIEPGRVFGTAAPGPQVPELTAAGARYARISQGDSAILTVKGAPLAPITLTSFDLGKFKENDLNSITVQADKDGLASATFVASPGSLNDVNILAGSPMSSGQVKFVVEIQQAGGPATAKPPNKTVGPAQIQKK